MDPMLREVRRRHPTLGIAFQYRFDGLWADAEDMACETRNAGLMYADDCALFAPSEADRQALYSSLAEVFNAEGMRVSLSETEASVARDRVNASEWLGPKIYHTDGSKTKEANARRDKELAPR